MKVQSNKVYAAAGALLAALVMVLGLVVISGQATPKAAAQTTGTVIEHATFESDLENHQNWYNASVYRSTQSPHGGQYSMFVESTAPYGTGVTLNNWPGYPGIVAGKTYDLSLWYREGRDTMPTATWEITWRNDSGTVLRADKVSLPRATAWTKAGTSVVAPTGATRIYWVMTYAVNTPGPILAVDDILVQEQSGTTTTTTPTTTTPKPDENVCTDPVWVTSGHNDMKNFNGYWLHNNVWNPPPGGSQTMSVCSEKSWFVEASNFPDNNGEVFSYPNGHLDFANWPDGVPVSNYSVIKSDFAGKGPGKGKYNVAYDIWMNGVGWACGNTELMIWTETTPGASPLGTDRGDYTAPNGQVYDVFWYNDGCMNVVSYLSRVTQTQGTMDLLHLMRDGDQRGFIPDNSTVSAVDYGIEFRYTDGTARFDVTNFSVACNPSCSNEPTPSTGGEVPVGSRVVFDGDFSPGYFTEYPILQNKDINGPPGQYCTYSACVVNGGPGHETAARFEIRPGDQTSFDKQMNHIQANERSEAGKWFYELGDERWYEFSQMLPSGCQGPTIYHAVVMQWHSSGLNLSLNKNCDLIVFHRWQDRHKVIGPYDPGKWHKYVLHVKHHPDGSIGFVEAYRDGKLVLPKFYTPTMSTSTDRDGKLGYYRGPEDYTSVIWYDDFRITAP